MAIVTSQFLAGMMTSFSTRFNEVFNAAENMPAWMDLAETVESNSDNETHAWLGSVPQMVDTTQKDLEVRGVNAYNYVVANKTWKDGIEVQRATFEDDKYNLVRPKIDGLAREAARHPGQLILQLPIVNGVAFDNVAFFADTRVIGESANIDNSLAGSGVASVANLQTDLGLARAAMRLFQDDMGRPMNNVPNVIMVPPALEQLMYQALNANQGTINQPVVPATADGVTRSSGFALVVNPYLTDVNDWFMFSQSPGQRPFVYQKRVSPALESVTMDNETSVVRDRFIYSVRARYNVGYGDPRYAVRIVN